MDYLTFVPDLAMPTRPPPTAVSVPRAETLIRCCQTVHWIMPAVELLTGYEDNAFTSTGNFAEDLLAITAIHPMHKGAVLRLLGKTGQDWSAVLY
jgi:hypothetical protein